MHTFLRWISGFFRTILRCLYDVKAYRGLRHKPLGEAAGYLAVLLAVFAAVPFMVFFFMIVRQTLDAAGTEIRKDVPAGTVFELKKGRLTSDLKAPIVVRSGGDVFIVNDASSTLTLSASDTGIVVTGAGAMMVKEDVTVEPHMIDLTSAPEARVTKEGMLDWLSGSAPWFVLLLSVLVLLAFTGLTAVRYGLSTALYALVVWLFLKLRKRPMPYKQAWAVSMYAVTGMVILGSAFEALGVDGGIIPTAYYWIVLAFVAYDLSKQEAHHEPEGKQDHGSGQGRA